MALSTSELITFEAYLGVSYIFVKLVLILIVKNNYSIVRLKLERTICLDTTTKENGSILFDLNIDIPFS